MSSKRISKTHVNKVEHVYYLQNLSKADLKIKVRLRGCKDDQKWIWSNFSKNAKEELNNFLEAHFQQFTHDYENIEDFMGSSMKKYNFLEYKEPNSPEKPAKFRCLLIF